MLARSTRTTVMARTAANPSTNTKVQSLRLYVLSQYLTAIQSLNNMSLLKQSAD
jgi:hypothetical protein